MRATAFPGDLGDGGPAIFARLNSPRGLAVDGNGNLYIADTGNNRIRKVTPSGLITTIAGSGTKGFSGDGGAGTSAQLNTPYAVAVDSAGNVYIADYLNSRIRKLAVNGVITTIAGNGTFSYSGDGGPATSAALFFPSGVAVDSSGNVYIADSQNNVIRMLTPAAAPGGTLPTVSWRCQCQCFRRIHHSCAGFLDRDLRQKSGGEYALVGDQRFQRSRGARPHSTAPR